MAAIVAVVLDTEKRLTALDALRLRPRWAEKLLHLTKITWMDDFAAARNEALEAAAFWDADWALWLDTDMHYSEHPGQLLEELKTTTADVITLPERGGRYRKDCLIRLPATSKYVGRTHEYLDYPGTRLALDHPEFWEDPKTPDQLAHKLDRDERMLRKMVALEGENNIARWWYYLADTLSNKEEFYEAVTCFATCRDLSVWDEERAWCCYRIACQEYQAKRYESAVTWSTIGMKDHAGIAELYWLAGVASYYLGRYRDAACWGEVAILVSKMESSKSFGRTGWHHPPVAYEAPHDLLRHAYRMLGGGINVQLHEHLYQRQLKTRLGGMDDASSGGIGNSDVRA